MISQKCPKCLSSRVRRGYRPTPIWSKIFFRYNLLCDNCNWEFTGFAVPGTVSAKPTKSPKKKSTGKLNANSIHSSSNSSDNLLQNMSIENNVSTENNVPIENNLSVENSESKEKPAKQKVKANKKGLN